VQWTLLDQVPAEQVRELLKIARRRTFSRNEVVFHRDDPADCLHLISKGYFAIRVMTPLGDVSTVAVRGPGDSFGEMALVGKVSRRTATVSALQDAETFALYRQEFERLCREQPSVNIVLFTFLVDEIRMLNQRLLEALYVPIEKRVRRRLLELASVYATQSGDVTIPLTQETLAELVGGSRATVNQILREEQRRGSIELQRGKTRLLDLDALAARAR